ncbi:MAG TPA: hypothetical protein PLX67_00895 [bacterium]|jgi:hypothetical protein|nr:hypothetical protein [bacterium]HNZ51684.1 hypothetical protein [bacterium]HOF79887.1 hypothetical protein [bacterium]HOH85406.1 hypothetical protein [bacterium]HOQ91820.1 hypothetical protein [bacterium]
MRLSPKTINWLMIGGVIIILIVLLYILLSGKLNPSYNPPATIVSPTTTTPEITQPEPQTFSTEQLANNQIILDNRGRLEIELEKKAGAFVERWASLSSQDNFSNLEILKNSMTQSMIAWTDDYIKNQSATKKTDTYIGTRAQAIVTQGTLDSVDSTSLTVDVKIRGQETIATASTQPKNFYQNYQLSLVKQNDVWLANKLTWQDRQYQ